MTPNEARELAAAAALGRMTPEDLSRLEEAAAGDPAFAQELEAYRATVAALEAGVARERPSADLLERIMAEIDALGSRTESEALRENEVGRRSFGLAWPRLALLGAAAAAAAVVAVAVSVSGGSSGPDYVAPLEGRGDYAAVAGEARLYDGSEPGSGRLVVELTSLPGPPDGHHYELWVLRAGTDAMESLGDIDAADGEAELEVTIPGAGTVAAVEVSVEPEDGNPQHSGVSLASGRFA